MPRKTGGALCRFFHINGRVISPVFEQTRYARRRGMHAQACVAEGADLELKLLLVGFACVVAGMLSVATLLKWREVSAVSRWLPAPGKIVSSRAEAREVTSPGSGSQRRGSTETRSFPAITFEYKAGGKMFRSSRYSVQENVGNLAVPETLAQVSQASRRNRFLRPVRSGQGRD
jgi:hypothetical protein